MKAFRNQHSAFRLILLALVSIALFSCKNDPEYRVGDLQALWLENGTQHYVRYTDETKDIDEASYFWGRELNVNQDVTEDDLYGDDFHGNGWFKYQLEKKGDLHEIHLMTNDGAVIPKEYIVSKLTSTELEYYEKGNKSRKFYFTKQ